MEIICGEKCEAKVDVATDTWFCKRCWKDSILERQPASSSWTTPGDVVNHSYRLKPPKPPAVISPPTPPKSFTGKNINVIEFEVHKSALPDFEVPVSLPLSLLDKSKKVLVDSNLDDDIGFKAPPYYKALIRLKFERSKEVKKEGVCFEQQFKHIPKIYTRIITNGLIVTVENVDEHSFVAKAQLEDGFEPSDYTFEYIVVPEK